MRPLPDLIATSYVTGQTSPAEPRQHGDPCIFTVLGERHLERVLREYCFRYFNEARPHQGIGQLVPAGASTAARGGQVISLPVLGGLHHDYRRAA
jgi:hypothetical protein